MKILVIIIPVAIFLHGLVLLMGTVTYMKLGTVQGLSYKTTLLGGRWDLGEGGMAVYGALWAVSDFRSLADFGSLHPRSNRRPPFLSFRTTPQR